MKPVFFVCFIALFVLLGAGIREPLPVAVTKPLIDLKDTIGFTKQIQPIMIKNCSPCHFPGGKMYEKLPFDKDTTIINHNAAILRRIKGEDNALIRAFVRQNAKQ
jgi:hypothetical protein